MKNFSFEEKRKALIVLIRQSLLIKQAKKPELISQVPTMSEEAIDAFGRLLAQEVKHAQNFYKEKLPQLETLLANLKDPAAT